MGRKPVDNRAEPVSISLPKSLLDRLNRMPGSRSSNIQRSLEQTLPKDYDIGSMEFFFNALEVQKSQDEIWHHLKIASVEEFFRTCWKIPLNRNVWDIVPPEVRDWCHAFVLPLEEELCQMSEEERKLFIEMAKRRLRKMLSKQ